MNNRLKLHALLKTMGTENVYFQPPESIKMTYPAIVYKLSNVSNKFANNSVYKQNPGYMVTVIDKDPDSEIVQNLSMLPQCKFDQHYTSDNLNHDVFTIFI